MYQHNPQQNVETNYGHHFKYGEKMEKVQAKETDPNDSIC
jgi:hypothetical protein